MGLEVMGLEVMRELQTGAFKRPPG